MALSISFSVCSRVWVMSLSLVSIPRVACESRARAVSCGKLPAAPFWRADSVERRSSRVLRGGQGLHRPHRGVAILARALRTVERAVSEVHQVLRRLHVVRRVVREAEAGGDPEGLAGLVLQRHFPDVPQEAVADAHSALPPRLGKEYREAIPAVVGGDVRFTHAPRDRPVHRPGLPVVRLVGGIVAHWALTGPGLDG